MLFTFIVGPAGAGKTHLTAALKDWLIKSGVDTVAANLDPGVMILPYSADFDIRQFVDYSELMDKLGLGPNGGLIAAIDYAVTLIDQIKDEIQSIDADHILVDCPGQMELFAYRSSGPILLHTIAGNEPSSMLFLIDANLARTARGLISAQLLSASIHYRFMFPKVNILSKSDLLEKDELERILNWVDEPFDMYHALSSESPSMQNEFSRRILEVLSEFGTETELYPVSAKNYIGLDNVVAILQRLMLGGDDYEIGK